MWKVEVLHVWMWFLTGSVRSQVNFWISTHTCIRQVAWYLWRRHFRIISQIPRRLWSINLSDFFLWSLLFVLESKVKSQIHASPLLPSALCNRADWTWCFIGWGFQTSLLKLLTPRRHVGSAWISVCRAESADRNTWMTFKLLLAAAERRGRDPWRTELQALTAEKKKPPNSLSCIFTNLLQRLQLLLVWGWLWQGLLLVQLSLIDY